MISVPDGTLVLEPRSQFDPCLVGYAHRAGEFVAVYSREKVIEALVADGMSEEDAYDHYDFNVSGAAGWGFPMFMLDQPDEDEIEPDWVNP